MLTQSRVSNGLLLVLPFVTLTLFCGHAIAGAGLSHTQPESSAKFALPSQQITPDSQAALRALIQSGNLPDLRWPDFSDYRKHLQKFYESYGYSLPWIKGMEPTAQTQQVMALLLKADQEGLSADDYDGPRWHDRLAKLNPSASQSSEAEALRFDLALTVCVMRYTSDVHIGKVNPKHFDFGLDVEAKKYDLSHFLKGQVVEAADVDGVLAQVEPPDPGYRRSIQALNTYLELAKQYDGKPLPPPAKPIVPGDSYPGVPQLMEFLRLVGDLPPDANLPADGTVYQGALVDAVKSFQRRHSRDTDGRITAQTFADLNVPLDRRVREMQLTLERWRWLPLAPHAAPIVANIPEFRVRASDKNFKVALAMNVVVGKAYGHGNPEFQDKMEYVVCRPYWGVPYSIIKNELIPHIVRDPDYLVKKNFEVVNSRQEVVSSGSVSSDVITELRAGKLLIRETPGPKNSLDLAKFIFPNNHVYMHDTPAHELFSRSRRDFSHGYIRLERPADLAAWVLRDNPGWDIDHVRAAMNGNTTEQVDLAHPIPVLILYATVVVTEDGIVHFFDDIYDHGAALDKVLQKGYHPWETA